MITRSQTGSTQWLLNLHTQDFWLSHALADRLSANAQALSFEDFLALLCPLSSQQLKQYVSEPERSSAELVLNFRSSEQAYHCRLEKMQGSQQETLLSGQLSPVLTSTLAEVAGEQIHQQILNILSHDLRNSLSSVIGFSQLLQRRDWVCEEGLDLLERIHQAGKNSHKLLQEMLSVQELKATAEQEHAYHLDLAALSQQVEEDFANQIREQDLSFECQVPSEIVELPLHKTWFRRLVDNLISNALKFTPPGGKILLKIEKQNQTLLLSVKDTGVGIPIDLQADLFTRFSASRRMGLRGEPSTGLGLYLVNQIVDLHQGQMGFQSESDLGTTFWIRLPVT